MPWPDASWCTSGMATTWPRRCCWPARQWGCTCASPAQRATSRTRSIVHRARHIAEETGARIELTTDPVEAVAGADAVYTDVWASMGQEEQAERRREVFRSYAITRELLEHAPDALVMHCLPAHRGDEITSEVLDGPRSIVFDQAEDRLWVQMALLIRLMRPDLS